MTSVQTPSSASDSQGKLSGCKGLVTNSGEPNGALLQKKVWECNERHKDGGLHFKDEVELKRQRGIAWEVVKGLGNSILEGKELVSTTLPIHLFEPRSFLERLTDLWAYAPRYLPQAAAIKGDPVERMKHVIAFAVSGLHLLTTARKPFNPILGETYQASFSNGTQIFCEQTTHHPPASNWEVTPADGSYKFTGHCTWGAQTRANTIKGSQKGPCHVDFADGSRITYSLPDVIIKGVMFGDRITELANSILFTDEKNGIEAEVVFNPAAMGFIKSLFTKSKESSDAIRGEIYKIPAGGASRKKAEGMICSIEGSWLSHLEIDGKRVWDIKTVPEGVIPCPNPLPSDCRYRADLIALVEGDMEKAKDAKVALEEKQRHEKKLRQQGTKNAKDGAEKASSSSKADKKSKKEKK